MANAFVHLELNTPDLAKAKEFYGEMFGWGFNDMEMGGGAGVYSTFKPSDGPGGGVMSISDAPTRWLPYVAVEDVKAATAKARTLGARVIMEAIEVPNMGWFSIFVDPTGAEIAIWEAKKS